MKIQALVLLVILPPALIHGQVPREASSADPTLATDSGDAALASRDHRSAMVFVDGAVLNGTRVFVTMSDGLGVDWSTPVRIDSDLGGSGKQMQETGIDVFGDHVFVTWQDLRHGNQEIYFNSSADGGLTWAGEVVLDKGGGHGVGGGDAFDWRMAVSPDPAGGAFHVYVLFRTTDPGCGLDRELYLAASHDSGATWDPTVHVPAGPAAGSCYDVEDIDMVVRNGTHLHVLWTDNRAGYAGSSYDVFYRRSMTGGATWASLDVPMNSVAGSNDGEVSIDVDGALVLVAWRDERTTVGLQEARYRYSTMGGGPGSWTPDQQVGTYTAGVDEVFFLDTLVNNGRLMIAYTDDRTGLARPSMWWGMAGGAFLDVPLSAVPRTRSNCAAGVTTCRRRGTTC